MKRDALIFLLAFIAVLSCTNEIKDDSFVAPEWGSMTAWAESSTAELSCVVSSSSGIVKAEAIVGDGASEIRTAAYLQGTTIIASVSGLKPETEYRYRFCISNGVYDIESSCSSFITGKTPVSEDFPDPQFRKYVLDNFDTDKDGSLGMSELSKVTKIWLDTGNVGSVAGIGKFKNLLELHLYGPESETVENSGLLTELDLSGNSKLRILECIRNNVASIVFPEDSELEEVYCWKNKLTALDVSMLSELRNLECAQNDFSMRSIDLSHNPKLEDLCVNDCCLTKLDISHNPHLTRLFCYSNNLAHLDVTSNPELVSLGANDNLLRAIDLNNNIRIQYCNLCDNRLEFLDASSLINAECILCGTDRLTDIILPQYSYALNELVLDANKLKECPDLSGYPNLWRFYIFDNQVRTVDVSQNPLLCDLQCRQKSMYYLFLSDTQQISGITQDRSEDYISDDTELLRYGDEIVIKDPAFRAYLLAGHDYDNDGSITISDVLHVDDITLFTNDVYSMDELKDFINLEVLHCCGDETESWQSLSGGLSSIDVSRCPKLSDLSITCNKFSTLPNLTNNLELRSLDIGHNKIGGILNLNFLPKLRTLHVGCNEIRRLNISSCTELVYCTFHYNNFEEMPDISKNTKITALSVSQPNFDVDREYFSNLTELEELGICGFDGEQLDFSKNVKIHTIDMSGIHKMKTADLSHCKNLRSITVKDEDRVLETVYVHPDAPLDILVDLNDNISLIRRTN